MRYLRSRLFLLMLLLVVVGVTSGCRHKVAFSPHSPYPTSTSYREPLVVVVPDTLTTERISVRGRGALFLNDYYHVYWGQALITESSARYSRMFSNVVVMSESSYRDAMTPNIDPDAPDTADILQAPGSLSIDAPRYVAEREGFLLRFENPRYAFDGRRGQIAADVTITDRRRDAVLSQGRVTASGTPMMPVETPNMMIDHLRRATVSTCSGMLLQIGERMRQVLESPPPATATTP